MLVDVHLDGYKAIVVWDMHGTLEVGNKAAVIACSNAVLQDMGFSERLEQNECDEWYGLKWFQYFQRLLPSESHDVHMELQARSFSYSEAHFDDVVAPCLQPTPYSHWVLSQLELRKYLNVLISNTQAKSVPQYTDAVGVTDFFGDFAYAVSNHDPSIPSTKEDSLDIFIQAFNMQKLPIFSVGDSPGDVDLGRHFRGKGILYAHDRKSMRKCDADYKTTDMRDVLTYILDQMGEQ
jgi:phosphoglycolate phosphatase-like HAD superfamily hydrolase